MCAELRLYQVPGFCQVPLLPSLDYTNRSHTPKKKRSSARDMVLIVVNEFIDDGRIYSLGKSVVDPKHPEVKGKVRANLKMSGWLMEPLPDRVATKATYITEIELGGWIPGNVLKMVSSKLPLVVAAVRKYLANHHAIAYPIVFGGAATSTPQFDHDSSKLEMDFEIVNAISPFTEISIPRARYPHGAAVSVTPVFFGIFRFFAFHFGFDPTFPFL